MRRTVIETVAAGAGLATFGLVVGVELLDRTLRLTGGRRLVGAVYSRTVRR